MLFLFRIRCNSLSDSKATQSEYVYIAMRRVIELPLRNIDFEL